VTRSGATSGTSASFNFAEDVRVKRLLVTLGVVAAVALLALLLWPEPDEDTPPAPPAPAPGPLEEPAGPAAEEPVARSVAEPAKGPAAVEPPVPPVAAGVLECEVASWDGRGVGDGCRLRVLLPTGAELDSRHVSVPGRCTFARLPTGVPLVVAVSAKECLSGLCCDVRLAKNVPGLKHIALLPSPEVRVVVTSNLGSVTWDDLRVELLAGEAVIAEGATDRGNGVTLRPPAFGEFRARVSARGETLLVGAPVVVEAVGDVQERTVDVPAAGTVEVRVSTASGAPARGVEVWLLGQWPDRPSVRADREGLAVFRGVPARMHLTAVARGGDGTFASAPVSTDDAAPPRIPLLLGGPATLTGDVVDQGNAALRGAVVEVIARPGGDVLTVRSDDAGLFETPPLAGGLAQVAVRCEGYLDWSSPQPVEIRPGVGARIRARMTPRPTGTVFVRVRDESGAAVAGAEVIAHPARARTTTDATGACRFDRLEAGSNQTFFARKKGYRSRAGALPSVRVPRDSAEYAGIVLRAANAEVPEGGPVSATGVVLGTSDEPLVAARVTAGAVVTFTDAQGRFRLGGLDATAADPVDLRIEPTAPSLLEPLRVLLDPDESGGADLGTVRLRSRPCAVLEIPAAPDAPPFGRRAKSYRRNSKQAAGDVARSRVFWFSSNHAETLRGAASSAFDPVACVSYDGTWMHLPPADDWATDGRGEVFVAFATMRGLFSTAASWTLAPDAAPVLSLPPPDGLAPLGGKLRSTRSGLTLRQIECATLFDPRSIHVPTGDPQAPIDPFARLAAWRTFTVGEDDWLDLSEGLAPGRWVIGDEKQARTIGTPAGTDWAYRDRK
jgi:hypothetical protein